MNKFSVLGYGLTALDIIKSNMVNGIIYDIGGTCFNIANNLNYLGEKTAIITRLGADIAGEEIIRVVEDEDKITLIAQKTRVGKTPRIIEVQRMSVKGGRHYFSFKCPQCGAFLPRYMSPTIDWTRAQLANIDINDIKIVYFDRVAPSLKIVLNRLDKRNTIKIYEPCNINYLFRNDWAFPETDVLKLAVSKNDIENKCLNKINQFCRERNHFPVLTLVTIGEEGVWYSINQRENWYYLKGINSNIIDSCGAGDWFSAILIREILDKFVDEIKNKNIESEKNLMRSLNLAQKYAVLSCKFIGARGLTNNVAQKKIQSKNNIGEIINELSITQKINNKLFVNINNKMNYKLCDMCKLELKL